MVASARDTLRRLWEEHVVWTRLAILSIVHALPDLSVTVARLMLNQDQLGQVIGGPFGGTAAVATLLREHIAIAAKLVMAAKEKSTSKVEALNASWRANADQIAAALAHFGFGSVEPLRAMLYRHLELTFAEAGARLAKEYAKDAALFDKISTQAQNMADMLAMRLEGR